MGCDGNWDQEPRVKALLEAARQGDTKRVLALLDAGVDVNALGRNNDTALSYATVGRHLDLIRALLDRGADTAIENGRLETPLTRALIQNGVWPGWRIDEPDPRPLAILHAAGARYRLYEAVLLNDLDLVRTRLDEGDSPDHGEWSYHGPVLKIAAELGYGGIVALLLDRGANIEATDDLGQRPLRSAAHAGHTEVARLLVERGAAIDARDWFGFTALTHARRGGNADLVAFLRGRGARWEIVDALEMADLPLLIDLVDAEIAQIVAEPTEDLSLIDEDDSALKWLRRLPVEKVGFGVMERLAMHAAWLGNVPALAFLLDRGAAHLLVGIDHHSLLAEAAGAGRLAAMRFLLDRGADLHAVGEDELTPLAWAMQVNHPEAVDLLRRAGATR